ncbi:MAG TPA: filamentous hemagglutinin N-terminal domain-containing protein, partial [Steroidobacteraceae bacterium]|nr:filamentous hemagglutinin N-terminal domain-containing protein [Steroidobacteraceae bacterium]
MRCAIAGCCPWVIAHGATLPIPCAASACGASVPGFVSAGQASAALAGSKLTVTQTSNNTTLNWQSFNISADGTVQFVQPSSSAVALNRIYDANPSQILGALDANGEIYLINQNGIVFGQGAQVNVGALVASTLNISPIAVSNNSLLAPAEQTPSAPAFQAFTDANGNVLSQPITIEPGASLSAADGGQIFIFAPKVTNLGTINTPDGQTVLAAGNAIYLGTSSDPTLRGILVQVSGDSSNVVTNGATPASGTSPAQMVGQIIAEQGNVTLAALAVNQLGRVSATTSVNENGSIILEANQGTVYYNTPTNSFLTTQGAGGQVTLGQNSDTDVSLDSTDPTVTVDSVAQPKSDIQISGTTVDMLQGSVARATSGNIDVTVAQNLGAGVSSHVSDGSRFYMAPGATLDVSGASITLPVSDNIIPVKLEANELADSPFQRGGVLQGQTIYVDIRDYGTNPDGSTWWGTPVADVSGEIASIARNVVERNLTGGTINIQSQGDALLAQGSTLDVAGGQIQYTGGYIDTTTLLTTTGQAVPIADASPYTTYTGIVNTTTVADSKWGVSDSYTTTPGTYSPGYVEGQAAGALQLTAPTFVLDGGVNASTVVGPFQRAPTGSLPSLPAAAGTSPLYAPYDEVPKSATLVVGAAASSIDEFVDGDLTIAPTLVLPGLTNADGSAFDPLTDPLPASVTTSILRPQLLGGPDGFDHIDLYSDGTITEPAGIDLALTAGGSFAARAGSIDLEGGIDAPGGSISATAEPTVDSLPADTSLVLGAGASLTARGAWVNDSDVLYPLGNTAPLYIDGGQVSLTAANPNVQTGATLQLDPGSLIDVTGGAQITSSHAINAGVGGQISIDAGTPISTLVGGPPQLTLGSTLRAYGLYEDGSLSIQAAGICIAASDCSGGSPTVLWLSPQFLNGGGFADYSLTADQGTLAIAPGSVLQLQQQNLQLPANYATLGNLPALGPIASVTLLPLSTREPSDLSLALYYPAGGFDSQSGEPALATASAPSFTIPQGVVIGTDPLGSITLSTDTRLTVDGTLNAPGGNISLLLDNGGLSETAYDPSQGIWLGSTGVLDVSGADEIFENSLNQRYGSVLAGGTVTLDAQRGYLELLPGSQILADGTSGLLDLTPPGGGTVQAQTIASAGGTISLSAAEGMVLGGSLSAGAGTPGAGANQPAGGQLQISLDDSNLNAGSSYPQFPSNPREIIIGQSLPPTVVAPDSSVPGFLAGLAMVSADTLDQGGFSTIAFASLPLAQTDTPGSVRFEGDVTLSDEREISFDAGSYSVDPGSTALVQAPYVELGNSDTVGGAIPTATGGSGVLDVSAGFLELYGSSALTGVGTVN